jgi:hypothetical protein
MQPVNCWFTSSKSLMVVAVFLYAVTAAWTADKEEDALYLHRWG